MAREIGESKMSNTNEQAARTAYLKRHPMRAVGRSFDEIQVFEIRRDAFQAGWNAAMHAHADRDAGEAMDEQICPHGMAYGWCTQCPACEPLIIKFRPAVRELLCQYCNREYSVWSVPNGLWNAVVQDGEHFLCLACFTNLAEKRGVTTLSWKLIAEHLTDADEPQPGHFPDITEMVQPDTRKKCECELRNRQWDGFGKCLTCGRQYKRSVSHPAPPSDEEIEAQSEADFYAIQREQRSIK